MHGIHRHAIRDAAVADAKRNDPTRTFSLRAKMRAEGDRRWQTLAHVLRSALIEHDIIGQRGMSKLPFGDKTEGFSMWLREELRQKVFGHDGRWLKPYVQQAAAHAQTRADEMLGTRDAGSDDEPRDPQGKWTSSGTTGVSEHGVRATNPDGGHLVYHWIDKKQAAKAIKAGVLKPTFTHDIPGVGKKKGISTGYDAKQWNLQDPDRVALVLDRSKIDAKAYDIPGNELYQLAQSPPSNPYYRERAVENVRNAPRDEAFFTEPINLKAALVRTLKHNDPEALKDAAILDRADALGLRTESVADAKRFLGIRDATVDPARVTAMESLAISELAGVCAAAQQQITRAVTHCMMANATPTATANAAAGVVKVMRNRTRAMSEYVVAKTHATSTLSAFRSAGIRRVGIDPERIRKTTRDKILLKDRRYSGPGSRSREETPSARTIGRIEAAQESLEEGLGAGEVDVVNGPDPCPICEEIADDGPYDLDEAEDLIPQHPFCMCAFVPAGEDDDDALALDYNEAHQPAGSSEGGQFAPKGGGSESGAGLDPAVTKVGGDEWNRQTAARLEREYQDAKPALEKLADDAVKGQVEVDPTEEEKDDMPFVPESWDEVGDTQQEEIKNDWMEKTQEKFLKDEVDNWHENGEAMDDTKSTLAYNGPDKEYVHDALKELIEERDEEEPKIPFSNEQLVAAMKFGEYQTGYEGSKDVEIEWDDSKLTNPEGWHAEPVFPGFEPESPSAKLTPEMRKGIEAKVVEAFNKEADSKVSDAEPPDYLKDNVGEFQDQYWDNLNSKDKFSWAEEYGHVGKADEKAASEFKLTRLPSHFDPLGEHETSEDYKLTKLLGRQMSTERAADLMVQRGIYDNRDRAIYAAQNFDDRLWTAWKGDSASRDGISLQAATARELGGRARGISIPDAKEDADSRYSSAGGFAGMQAYVRAKWETTQYLLDKANKPTIDVYRGILMKDKGTPKAVEIKNPDYSPLPFHYDQLPDLSLERNGAQSTTTDHHLANTWKGVGAMKANLDPDKDRVVIRIQVPRTAALSIPAYGQNLYDEHEVVLAGTAWKGWDAWQGHAPEIKQVPLQ